MSLAGCLLFGYVISLGPVVGLAARGHLGSDPYPYIRQFYAPLLYLQDHNQMVARAVEWYESRFVPQTPSSVGPLTAN